MDYRPGDWKADRPGKVTKAAKGTLVAVLLLMMIAMVQPVLAVTIKEYTIPTTSSFPFGITAGPDGSLWFTESSGSANKIGKVTTSGAFTEYTIPSVSSSPTFITVGPDGNLWFTEYPNKIGKVTTSGVFTEYPVPTAGSGPFDIIAGPDGNLWFTEAANNIGKVTTNGVFTEYPVPTANGSPFGITAGPDGNLWFTEINQNKIGVVVAQTPDFSISATSACSGSGCATFATITLTGFTGFSGTVALTDIVPSGLSCSPITPSSINLPPWPAKATLTCSASAVGTFNVTLTATSGTLVHSANATFSCSTASVSCSSSVGGEIVPVNMVSLLAPFIGPASLIVATGITALVVRRVKQRREASKEKRPNPQQSRFVA